MRSEDSTASRAAGHGGGDDNALIAAVETVVVSLCAVLLFYIFSPQDPLMVLANFPWPVLLPLVIGLRYGTVNGLGSALVVVLSALFFYNGHEQVSGGFPLSYALGLFVVALLAGQGYDKWASRYHSLSKDHAEKQSRLQRLRRDYHLLRLSHGNLEQRLMGDSGSLREALSAVRNVAMDKERKGRLNTDLAWRVLQIFSDFGGVQTGSVYSVETAADEDPVLRFVAAVGVTVPVSRHDEAVAKALDSGRPVVLGENAIPDDGGLIAAIPLTDSDGCVIGLVAISEIAFLDFNDQTIDLLAMVAGHVADLLSGHGRMDEPGCSRAAFRNMLNRAIVGSAQAQTTSSLVLYQLDSTRTLDQLCLLFSDQLRHTDCYWTPSQLSSSSMVAELLLYSDLQSANEHISRISRDYQERWGHELRQPGVTIVTRAIDSTTLADELLVSMDYTGGASGCRQLAEGV